MSTVNGTAASDVLSQYQLKGQEAGKQDELGKNEFMELMIAQLKNQNPLEPQDNGDFIAQLAQFSSLEEMQTLSGNVNDVVGEFRSTQALQASAMVGRSVLVPAENGLLGADGQIKGAVNVPASTSNLRVSIVNQAGEIVRQIEMGSSEPGQTSFVWDGKDGNGTTMPTGTYGVIAQGAYPSGTEQLATVVSANVDSVSLGQAGGITLNLAGMGSIALSQVQQIN
ncbi:MAG: flagellar hook assembly protein FlgD [Marinobacter sp.]|uniref:flagellar hook assembly protein FlgD n=1 Tax=Marinobacter sp. TaxID=50741 RepID=UPI00349FFDDF